MVPTEHRNLVCCSVCRLSARQSINHGTSSVRNAHPDGTAAPPQPTPRIKFIAYTENFPRPWSTLVHLLYSCIMPRLRKPCSPPSSRASKSLQRSRLCRTKRTPKKRVTKRTASKRARRGQPTRKQRGGSTDGWTIDFAEMPLNGLPVYTRVSQC